MKLKELSEVEILIMKSIWKLGDDITTYDIIEYLKEHYDRNYARSTVKTYVTKLKGKGFLNTEVRGNYSYITAIISEEDERLLARWFRKGDVSDIDQDDHTRGERGITGFDR